MFSLPTILYYLFITTTFNGVESFKACNLYQECQSQNLEDKQITCYGHESCSLSTMTGTDSMPRYMNCDGSESCAESKIVGFQYMYCQGSKSCESAREISSDHIECGGADSCKSIDNLIETRNMYCEGSKSCSKSNIKSGVEVTCNGHKSCFKSNIQCMEDIQCNGVNSCSGSKLISHLGEITCNGKGGCHSTEIDTNTLTVYSHYGASYADINAEMIQGMGYYSLMYTMINSNDRDRIHIKSHAHLSGYGATVLCQSGSKCTLECKSTGCMNMDFVCLYGSKCEVSPNECGHRKKVSSDGIECPIWSQSESKDEDKVLMEYIEQRKLDRVDDDINNKCLMELKMNDEDGEFGINIESLITGFSTKTKGGYHDLIRMIFASIIYSNLFISFIVFMVTFIFSWCFYSMKYRGEIYKQIR